MPRILMPHGNLASRRTFLGSATCVGALVPSSLEAQAFLPTIVRFGSRAAGGLAGFIFTEVVLGVLRAYGIDIAGSIESLVRDFRGQPVRGVSRRTVMVVVPDDVDVMIVRSGSCSGGSIAIDMGRYSARAPRAEVSHHHPRPIAVGGPPR